MSKFLLLMMCVFASPQAYGIFLGLGFHSHTSGRLVPSLNGGFDVGNNLIVSGTSSGVSTKAYYSNQYNQGPAADGNGYLWNANSQVGAYTFVVSGKKGDSYAEYKQDYFDAKLVTLLQPQYREWQGQYKSCNGASYFTYRKDKFPYYVSGIEGLSEEFKTKTDW